MGFSFLSYALVENGWDRKHFDGQMVFVQEKCKINNYDIRNGDYYYCIQLKNKIYLSEFSFFFLFIFF